MTQAEIDISYLAGMLDADGSFSIVKDRGGYRPQISISNAWYPMLEWCGDLGDCTFSISLKKKRKAHHKYNYDLKWVYNPALIIASLVKDYLHVKSKQAECLIRWRDVVKRNGLG